MNPTSWDLAPRAELPPAIGLLAAMLDDVRRDTLKGVEGLSAEDLLREPAPGEAPLGAYLMHLGEAEIYWLEILSGTPVAEDVKKDVFYNCWFDPSETPAPPSKPLPLEEYVSRLAIVRGLLHMSLRDLADDALADDRTVMRGGTAFFTTPRWILHHLIEHEAHHRGQMMLWKRRMGL